MYCHVLTAIPTSTVLRTRTQTSTASPESTAATSVKTSGMKYEAVVFTLLCEMGITR